MAPDFMYMKKVFQSNLDFCLNMYKKNNNTHMFKAEQGKKNRKKLPAIKHTVVYNQISIYKA